MRALVLLAAVAVGVLALDQFAKYLVVTNLEVGEMVPVLGEFFQLHFVKNSGAAFSLASGFTWILSIVAVGVIVLIIVFAKRIRSIAWAFMFGLLLGGALGNVTDRLFREPGFGTGHVIDFLQFWGFPAIFNLADVAIVTGMGLFLLLALRGVGLDGVRVPSTTTPATEQLSNEVDPDEPGDRPAGA
ncbi:signal peptidase II [Protaetiibacter larvae]|uniref:Lipoprotein signal peptidase n=1 Tax=Protaetiibacter larvae TaxID=2592654 RepID=A0A5C1YD66_9MICO|nr:signal peptidase II [Protaetiibacter larvae]